MKRKIINLQFNQEQKNVFFLLLISGFSDGVSEGILILQETIALKALKASKFQISLISVIMFSTLIFSLFFTSYLKGKPKTKVLTFALIGGRLIFLFSFIIKSTNLYLVFLFLFYSTYSISFPVINMFYQRHFPYKRGFVFGVYRMILMLLTMVMSVIAGKVLDINPLNYKIILSFVGIFSSTSFIALILIDRKTNYPEIKSNQNISHKHNFLENIKEIIKVKDFLVFEALFMTYGFGFMIIQPAIPVYLINILGFSYSQMAYAKGVFAMLFRTLLFPFVGLFIDRVKPWRVGTFAYFTIIFFPLLLIFSKFLPDKSLWVYLGFSFFSLALTGLSFMWNLGSIYFAKNKESSTFQGFHVTLTGIRGLLGPLFGFVLITYFDVMANFYAAIILFFVAGVGTILYKWEK